MTPIASNLAAQRAAAAYVSAIFASAGALPIEADVLQPAGTLLDLYGEDIRARAYVTSDPMRGELMLRPDFTVPAVLGHLESAQGMMRYTYSGAVFRKQEDDPDRPAEFLQVGYEVMGAEDAAAADAEVFALVKRALGHAPVRAAIGDIGLLRAATQGLQTTERRKRALLRHLWRPRRYRALMERFGGSAAVPAGREALLAALRGSSAAALVAAAGPQNGKRRAGEVEARLLALAEDAETPPIPERELRMIEDLLAVRDNPRAALERLRDIAVDMPVIEPAVERLALRLSALEAQGVDLDVIEFETTFGRSSMEYYDGFVFGFYAGSRADLPPVASGGRYDALTAALGRPVPAVGGVIRPDVLAALGAGGSI
ncbi:ATP phosphoribosyltransferase regulatory subunit [Alphaproteobacteria bacterium KMM 3653]|uniref:ATP phosphoribosyltransferase regulatory subunit n=1 Tax=Harenicola maris TaxID=2841044 RepID=A0AAP2CRW3_9RHOB|nr:ATP phosphoribosyltransferase regulatory subunit [Harenicola maris]